MKSIDQLQNRAQFEKTMRDWCPAHWSFTSDGYGGYENHATELSWIAWQGATGTERERCGSDCNGVGELKKCEREIDRLRQEFDQSGKLAEAMAKRFAHALVYYMDGTQDHDIQSATGLPEDKCTAIAAVRKEAAEWLVKNWG